MGSRGSGAHDISRGLLDSLDLIFNGDSVRKAYLTATADELDAELKWAAARPNVIERRQSDNEFDQDGSDTFLYQLTLPERRRYDVNRLKFKGELCDLGQEKRIVKSTNGRFPTATAGMGIWFVIVHDDEPADLNRWIVNSELLTGMGFVVSPSHSQACHGALSQFGRSRTPPSSRTISSVRSAIGDSFHINWIGQYLLTLLLMLPEVGNVPFQARNLGQQLMTFYRGGDDGRKKSTVEATVPVQAASIVSTSASAASAPASVPSSAPQSATPDTTDKTIVDDGLDFAETFSFEGGESGNAVENENKNDADAAVAQGSEKQQLQDSSDDGWSHHPSDGWQQDAKPQREAQGGESGKAVGNTDAAVAPPDKSHQQEGGMPEAEVVHEIAVGWGFFINVVIGRRPLAREL